MDTVDSDAGLRGPGQGRHQRKGGGILGSSGHHLSSGTNLRGKQQTGIYGLTVQPNVLLLIFIA